MDALCEGNGGWGYPAQAGPGEPGQERKFLVLYINKMQMLYCMSKKTLPIIYNKLYNTYTSLT